MGTCICVCVMCFVWLLKKSIRRRQNGTNSSLALVMLLFYYVCFLKKKMYGYYFGFGNKVSND